MKSETWNGMFRKIIYSELFAKATEKEERERRRRKKAKEDFMTLLKKSGQVTDATTWEEAKELFSDRIDPKV